MFRITRDPSSKRFIQRLAKITVNILKYFIIILIVSTNYIFVGLLDNKVF